MTRREIILGCALLCAGVIAAFLWLQLRAARESNVSVQKNVIGSPAALQQTYAELRNVPAAPSVQVISPEPAAPIGPVSTNDSPNAAPAMPRENRPQRAVQLVQASNIIRNNDLNGDGLVTREEARTTGGALTRMWDRYDANKDGVVEDWEIQGLNDQTKELISKGELGQSIIASNDLNQDGIVTKEEATKANKALIQLWNRYDRNRDGKLDSSELRGPPGR